jgi:hypothetical protein
MKNTQNQTHEVIDHVNAFMKASIEKDMTFMKENLHADFLFTTPRGTLFNKSSFLSDFVSNPAFMIEVFELLEQKVILIDKIAVLNGIIKIRFKGQEEQYERTTVLLILKEDKGMILNIQGTFTTRPK